MIAALSTSPPPHRSIADPAEVAALLQIGLDHVVHRGLGRHPLRAMSNEPVAPEVLEAAIRALHAEIGSMTRWWRKYGESASAPFPRIARELEQYLERSERTYWYMLFGRATRRQQREPSRQSAAQKVHP